MVRSVARCSQVGGVVTVTDASRDKTRKPIGRDTKSQQKRWNFAVDRVLNSGLMDPHMTDFWAYVDLEITWEEFNERLPR